MGEVAFSVRRVQISSTSYGYVNMSRSVSGVNYRMGVGDAWSGTFHAVNSSWDTCSISSGADVCYEYNNYNATYNFQDTLLGTDLNTLQIRIRSNYQDAVRELKFTTKGR